jgi:hypothetical protein
VTQPALSYLEPFPALPALAPGAREFQSQTCDEMSSASRRVVRSV